MGGERADALVVVAEKALVSKDPVSRSAVKHEIVVHADLVALAGVLAEETAVAHIQGGGPISAEALGRIACGASIVPLIERGGEPLSVGRASRAPSAAIRRALRARDEMCRFPGCARGVYTEAHHLTWWASAGETKLDNLVLLCWTHHRLVHDAGITVTKTDDGFVFRASDGTIIEPRASLVATAATLAERNRGRGVVTDDSSCYPGWGGEEGDLRYAADVELGYYRSLGLPRRDPPVTTPRSKRDRSNAPQRAGPQRE